MESRLDLDSWPRRAHFEFFKTYEQPYFNICADVDVSVVRDLVAGSGSSFFLATLFLSQKAANAVESFRYRLRTDGVVVHDRVRAGCTVLRDDDTFGFAYFSDSDDFRVVEADGKEVVASVRPPGLPLEPELGTDAVIYYSVIPWIRFTSFAHAHKSRTDDSIPRIVLGKKTQDQGAWMMPASVEVHHALMDGLHVGEYFERFQQLLSNPRSLDATR